MTSVSKVKRLERSFQQSVIKEANEPQRERISWNRLLAYLALSLLALVAFAPTHLALLTCTVATLSIAYSLIAERVITLGTVFELGFLTLVGADIALNFNSLQRVFELRDLEAGVALHVLAFATVMTAYYCYRERPRAKADTAPEVGTSSPSLFLLATLYVMAVASVAPRAVQRFSTGRSGSGGSAVSSDSAIEALLGAIQHGLVISLTALVTYTITQHYNRGLALSLAASAPLLLLVFMIGTRYLLLYAVAAPLIIALARGIRVGRFLLTGGIIAVIAMGATAAMRSFRTQGLSNSSLRFDPLSIFGSEGLVKTSAQLVQYFETRSHLLGESTLSVLTSPIPRALWSEKPTLIGYWFPREVQAPSSFSEGHSVSFGIIGDAYADGGTIGVLLISIFIGLLLAKANAFARRAFFTGGRNLLFASLCYPTAFFAVRSPTTALLTLAAATGIIFLATAISSPRKLATSSCHSDRRS